MQPIAAFRRLVVGCALIAIAGVPAAGQKYGVTVTAERDVDFARLKTYSWTTGQPSPDRRIDGQIKAAVDRELAALGLTQGAPGAVDVLVTYRSVQRTDVDINARPDAAGLQPQQSVGTLVVALLDPQDRRDLLRLRTDTPIDTATATKEEIINSAVAELFTHFPKRAR